MNYIKVTYPVGSSFIKSTFEDNSSYIRTSVNSTFIKVSYDGGSSGLDAERLRTKVYNVTGATLTKGTVVYINGTHGNLPSVTKAIATGDATSAQTLGLVMEDILDNKSGYIIIAGKLSDLDTQAFADGSQLYLSSTVAGTYTTTKQYAPAHLVYVGIVNRSHPTQGEIEVKIQNGYEADEIHDFAVRNPLNNQGIFFNSTTNLWEKKYVSDALGYTPANASTTLTINGVTFDLSQNRSWTIAAGISGSGTSGQVSYWTGASSLGGSNNLFWDAANNRLGIGTNSPSTTLDIRGKTRIQASGNCEFDFVDGTNIFRVAMGSSGGFIGTLTSHPFSFFTGALKRGEFSTNGNLIIQNGGTFTDDGINRLQVSGSAKFTSDILVNGINIGLGAGNVASNLRFGGSALLSNTTGAGNVALGYAAMYYNTGGSNNMAIGVQALVGNSTGDNNVAVGTAALFGNTNGYNNVAIGHWAAYDSVGSLSNSVGANNIFIGYGCLGESGIESNRTWIGNASTTSTWLGGNLLLGTRTNGTDRLRVFGNAYFRTAGNTSSTFGFKIENSTPSTIFEVRDDGSFGIGGPVTNGYKLRVYGNIWATGFDQLSTLQGSSGVGAITFYDQGTLTMGLYGTHAAESVKGFFTLRSQDVSYTTPTTTLLHADADFADHPTMIIRSRNGAANSLFFANYHYTLGALFSTIQPAGGNSDITFRPNRTNKFVISATATYTASVLGDALVTGSGNTNATNALLVRNSDGTNILRVGNDRTVTIGLAGGAMVVNTNSTTLDRMIFQVVRDGVNPNFYVSNIFGSNPSGTYNVVSTPAHFQPTSGTAVYNTLVVNPTVNQTGGANGVTRGLYVAPTLTSASDFRAIETTNGKIIFGNLPTSSAGLPTGTLWNDAGTLKVA